ncbi:hypothetical protein [Polyangium sp. 15x6]|uniref:hypothetical protein n=1 Tax=Polyangium sp. 15x6 TaxID=3042687 RepID=UPI00249B76A7|nr:hypothetical protein [Polyangium sp. 15x6]MDI3284686.1 hypothetical protein [Polyangium sp. 15x6]
MGDGVLSRQSRDARHGIQLTSIVLAFLDSLTRVTQANAGEGDLSATDLLSTPPNSP